MDPPIQDIDQWVQLPEFMLPKSGDRIVNVVRAGFIVGELAALAEAGVQTYLPLEDGANGLLGLITVETETGMLLLRLPQVVANWAAECCVAAANGVKLLPARVRFRALEGGVEVSFVGPASTTTTSARKIVVFVDESGNNGDAAIASGPKFVGGQAPFALVGVGEEDGSGAIDRVMTELRTRYKIKGGEIKGRAMDRRPQLVADLVDSLSVAALPVFIEVMDPAYYIAANLVTNVLVGPRLLRDAPQGPIVANYLADALTEQLDPTALLAYGAFAKCPTSKTFTAFGRSFRSALAKARGQTEADADETLAMIQDLFEIAVESCDDEASFARLLPPPDYSRSGKRIAMLPHIPAFTNLYARVNNFASEATSVHVFHDEQSSLDRLLNEYARGLESNVYASELITLAPAGSARWSFVPDKFQLEFGKSETSSGIQAADILARYCTRRLNNVVYGRAVGEDPVIRQLFQMGDATRGIGINIVTTARRADLFLGNDIGG